MCRIVGIAFRNRIPLDVLDDLRDVSRTGKIWDGTVGHKDGWGIAAFRMGMPYYLDRQPTWAAEDPRFMPALERASALESPGMLIAHVRAASKGRVSIENTHPFIVGRLVVGHNGTIRGYRHATNRSRVGTTDSELLALTIADRYEETGNLRDAIRSVVKEEVDTRKETPLGTVIVVSDGKMLCGYRDFSQYGSYYDLRVTRRPDSVVLYQETNGSVKAGQQVMRRGLICVDLLLGVHWETID